MPVHVSESTGCSITATWELSTGTMIVSPSATWTADVLGETTAGAGITIDGLLIKDSSISLDPSPDVDDTAEGIVADGLTAGENLAFPNLCYMKSDGKYWKADADASTTMPGVAIALETILADATGKFLKIGFLRDDTLNFTVGGLVYASTTGASISQTAPSGSGDQVQVVGYAVSADVLWFNPSLVLVEVA